MADSDFMLPQRPTVIISGISVLFIYVLSMYADSLNSETNALFMCLSTLGSGGLLLLIQFGIFNRNRIEEEKKIIGRVMSEQAEQYRLSKENIDMINIKCHDLKHRIDELKGIGSDDKQEQIAELEKLLDIYEAGFRTTNNALNTVLTKKALQCNDLNIKLFSVIDGAAVSMMKDEDIYVLFGNILDNAIEYLSTIDDESLKQINLNISLKNKLLIIHAENYCAADLKFNDELPLTTKSDKDNHGFGMLSIKYIVDKYNGVLSVKRDGDRFILNIVIPE